MKIMGGSIGKAGALVAFACVSVLGASLVVVSPAAAAETCGDGPPVSFDFNGDDRPDLAAFTGDAAVYGSPVEVQSADLNGDKCADLIDHTKNVVTWVLGSPSGVDASTAQTIQVGEPEGEGWFDGVVAMREDGVTRIIAATDCDYEVGCNSPFLDVVTLDAAGKQDHRDRVSLAGKLSNSAERYIPLAADDGVLVVGDSDGQEFYVYVSGDDPSGFVFSAEINQESPGVPGKSGTANGGDLFGAALALRDGYLAVGVPWENVDGVADAGRVQLFRWNETTKSFVPGRSIDQGTKGVVGTNEKADRFGSSLAIGVGLTGSGSYDVIVGSPDENVGSAVNAGSVTVLNYSKVIYRTYTQSTSNVPGAAKKYRWFGHDVRSVGSKSGAESLAATYVGVRDADGTASRFDLVYTNPGKLTSATKWHTLVGTQVR